MRVTAILGAKGGTGKSTCTLNTAAAWSAKRRVGVIDLDPQGNLTSALAHLTTPGSATAAEVLIQAAQDPTYVIQPDAWSTVQFEDKSGFWLLPTPESDQLTLANDLLVSRNVGGGSALKRALSGVRGMDAILIDTAPSITRLTLNAVVAATSVFGVTTLQQWSVEGAVAAAAFVEQAKTLDAAEADFEAVLVNRVKGRKTQVSEKVRKVLKGSGLRLLENQIPERSVVEASEYLGIPVVLSEPKSDAAKAFEAAAKEMWKMSNPDKKGKKK